MGNQFYPSPEVLKVVEKDVKGKLLFLAIKNDDKEQLKILIDNNANLSKFGMKCLQSAVTLEHWDCVLLLLDHSYAYIASYKHKFDMSDKDEIIAHNLRRMGHILLSATKYERKEIITSLFKLIEHIPDWPQTLKQKILFKPGKSFWELDHHSLWRDTDNGYTALHWAVAHNDPSLCKLFKNFIGRTESFCGDSPIFKATDSNNQTALDLAISLNHIDCAKQIAKGMSLKALINAPVDTLKKALFLNIQFSFIGSHSLFSNEINHKRKMIYQYILSLPIAEKKHFLEMAITKDTTAYKFFHFNTSKYNEKLYDALIELNKNSTEISVSTFSLFSTAKLQVDVPRDIEIKSVLEL